MDSTRLLKLAQIFEKKAQMQLTGKPFDKGDITNALINAGLLEGDGSQLNGYFQQLLESGAPGDFTVAVTVLPGPKVDVKIGEGIKEFLNGPRNPLQKKLVPILNEEKIRSETLNLASQFPVVKKVTQFIGQSS